MEGSQADMEVGKKKGPLKRGAPVTKKRTFCSTDKCQRRIRGKKEEKAS